ncbi:MAG: septum formation inhibitor Maf, partial [Candidatus Dadabacteria bacterium]|nr:septum formation inhibitor Maf [Candidatus Dadabacteria bacterium]
MDETGVVLHSEAVFTDVKFKSLAPDEIEGYIKTGEPMDKAGAYAIQGRGSFMVEEINGSFTNVVGLPLSRVVDVLAGLKILELFSKNGN